MKTTIVIDCEDEKDILTHLACVRAQIRAEVKRQGGTIQKATIMKDSNCYGEHEILITPTEPPHDAEERQIKHEKQFIARNSRVIENEPGGVR